MSKVKPSFLVRLNFTKIPVLFNTRGRSELIGHLNVTELRRPADQFCLYGENSVGRSMMLAFLQSHRTDAQHRSCPVEFVWCSAEYRLSGHSVLLSAAVYLFFRCDVFKARFSPRKNLEIHKNWQNEGNKVFQCSWVTVIQSGRPQYT